MTVALVRAIKTVLLIGTAYELIVQLVGLGWFWSSFSLCAQTVAIVGIVSLAAGGVSLFIHHLPRVTVIGFSITFAVGFLAFVLMDTGVDIPCGEPLRVKVSWLSFALLLSYIGLLLLSASGRGDKTAT